MANTSTIPEPKSYEEIAEFWDAHDLGDYWDMTEEAHFEIAPQARRRYLVAIEPKLLERVHRLAFERGQSTARMIHELLEQGIEALEKA